MIQYTDIKEARRQLRLLQYTFHNLQARQEHLRSYIHQCGNEDLDVRAEIYDNRLMLGKLERRIKKLNGNILKLDWKMTMKDIDRQIREYPSFHYEEYKESLMEKINKASKVINEKTKKR